MSVLRLEGLDGRCVMAPFHVTGHLLFKGLLHAGQGPA